MVEGGDCMVVVSIEEVIDMAKKLKEINETKFEDLLFVSKMGKKVGVIVVRLDPKEVSKFTKLEPMTTLIISGDWQRCVMEEG
jgi:hypothetical protein